MSVQEGWAGWGEATGVQRRVKESAQRHRASPDISSAAYLATKRTELAEELQGKRLIYLDTKHWVNLCHVVVQAHQQKGIYDDILHLLGTLRQKGRICCPVSAALFMELMKQNDISTRSATARTMDFLSAGVCLQNWLQLARAEFGRHVCRVFPIGLEIEVVFPIWTKIGYWAGEHSVEFPMEGFEDNAVLEKVYTDLRWEMTCEDYQIMPSWTPTPKSLYDAWLKDAELAKSQRSSANLSFQTLVQTRRRQLLEALRGEWSQLWALCKGQPGGPDDHVRKVLDPIYDGSDPNALPSLEVVAGLDAAITLDKTRKVQANDLEDYLHAAQALAYCDAFFCDNFMAQKLRHRPLEFGKVYKTHIGSRPEDILGYLKTLE